MKTFDEAPQALRSQGKDSPPISQRMESPGKSILDALLFDG
jgi:hypothetical protein